MARVEVALPDPVIFTTELPVRISDVNYGNHLSNDAVLAMAHEARLRWVLASGFASELDIDGVGFVMSDAAIVYRAEGRHGMPLRIDLGVADVRSRGFDLLYRFTDGPRGTEIARVKTGIVWFDYARRKVVHMPEAFRRVVGAGHPAG
jgi:4-hydroxybenzoyl-CoA thioesterase